MESMNLFGKNSEERNDGLVHYQGELGDFWYDPNEFEVLTHERAKFWYDPKESVLTAHEKVEFEYLHYVGNNGAVDLPKGCTNTRYMFWDCELPEGFQLIAFNTSNVEVMEHMFYRCRIPTGFSLGDEFSTSNVIDMSWMFAGCKISTGFTLGHKFDTSKVKTMEGMFYGCEFPENSLWEIILILSTWKIWILCFMVVNFHMIFLSETILTQRIQVALEVCLHLACFRKVFLLEISSL